MGAGNEIKEIDRKIISLLIQKKGISNRELAKKLKVSPLTIANRLEFLRKEKLLFREWIPNYKKLGYDVLIITTLTVKPEFHSIKNLNFIKRQIIDNNKKAIFCHKTANYRIITIHVAKSVSDFQKTVEKVSEKYSHMITDREVHVFSYVDDEILNINDLWEDK
ncbi:MAG: winged helix-turn-helix transcriptional regulator [Nanoarchaeota archaeon]|nr:winged helix-turn-helix transcriptional regulator [Nanoarchaeota archaeon]